MNHNMRRSLAEDPNCLPLVGCNIAVSMDCERACHGLTIIEISRKIDVGSFVFLGFRSHHRHQVCSDQRLDANCLTLGRSVLPFILQQDIESFLRHLFSDAEPRGEDRQDLLNAA